MALGFKASQGFSLSEWLIVQTLGFGLLFSACHFFQVLVREGFTSLHQAKQLTEFVAFQKYFTRTIQGAGQHLRPGLVTQLPFTEPWISLVDGALTPSQQRLKLTGVIKQSGRTAELWSVGDAALWVSHLPIILPQDLILIDDGEKQALLRVERSSCHQLTCALSVSYKQQDKKILRFKQGSLVHILVDLEWFVQKIESATTQTSYKLLERECRAGRVSAFKPLLGHLSHFDWSFAKRAAPFIKAQDMADWSSIETVVFNTAFTGSDNVEKNPLWHSSATRQSR